MRNKLGGRVAAIDRDCDAQQHIGYIHGVYQTYKGPRIIRFGQVLAYIYVWEREGKATPASGHDKLCLAAQVFTYAYLWVLHKPEVCE
jgi:hypothetical protein